MATWSEATIKRTKNGECSDQNGKRRKGQEVGGTTNAAVSKSDKNQHEFYSNTLSPGGSEHQHRQLTFSSVFAENKYASSQARTANKDAIQLSQGVELENYSAGREHPKDALEYNQHGLGTKSTQDIIQGALTQEQSLPLCQSFTENKLKITNLNNANGSLLETPKGVCYEAYDKDAVNYPIAINERIRKSNDRNVLTFVRPSPRKTTPPSPVHSVSRTRQLGTLLSKGSHSDPYLMGTSLSANCELKELERSLRGRSHPRVFEGGRLLFCKTRVKKDEEPLLSPQGSPSEEDLTTERTWSNDGQHGLAVDQVLSSLLSEHGVPGTPASRTFGRSLIRQKSFEVDENNIDKSTNTLSLLSPIAGILDSYSQDMGRGDGNQSMFAVHGDHNGVGSTTTATSTTTTPLLDISALIYTGSKSSSWRENVQVTCAVPDNVILSPDSGQSSDVTYDITKSPDVTTTSVTSDEMFSQPASTQDRSSGYSSSYLCVTSVASSLGRERRLSERCPSDMQFLDDGGVLSSSERTFVKSSSSISAPPSMNDISDGAGDTSITVDTGTKSVSESATLSSIPRSRIKLALSTSHAGIYVTGDSQDDPEYDPAILPTIERCPSWLGDQTGSSLFLSLPKKPDTTPEPPHVQVCEKKNTGSISFSSRTTGTMPTTSSSSPLLSARYSHTSSAGSQEGPKGKRSGLNTERSKSALLSPSFRTIQDEEQMWAPKCGEPSYSSGDSARSSIKEGDSNKSRPKLRTRGAKEVDLNSSFPPPRVRKTAALTPPNLRARSHDFDQTRSGHHRSSSAYLSPYYHSSISSDGDSGVDTPRSYLAARKRNRSRSRAYSQGSTNSNPALRTHAQFSSQDRCPSKTSLSQSIKSTSSFFKRRERGESFLSLISPRRLFSHRKNSDQSGRSSVSRSSRKRLSDFPDDGNVIVINVSGRRFKLHEFFTSVYPETLLGNKKRNQYYDPTRKEFFFDHDPDVFRHIWNFYYTGKLHFPRDECVELFMDEIKFFGIPDEYLCTCCWEDEFDPAKEKLLRIREENQKRDEEEMRKNRRIPASATLKEKIWLTTKDPMISTGARVFYLFSVLAIVLSTFANIVETITCAEGERTCSDDYKKAYFYIDTICVIFFTLEYALKVVTAPNRWKFVKKFMSIIDVLAILPYYCDLLLRFAIGSKSSLGIDFLEILRILRIVRIFKLLRHSRRLQDLTQTVRGSTTELGLILFIYFVLVIVFSSIMYYAEMQDNPKFVSIPEAMWYAVITTTTTGYGDIVPETVFGKVIGCACCILGVLIVALPVPILQIK